MKQTKKKNRETGENGATIKFVIELPVTLDQIIRQDAKKSKRSRRAQVAYVLTEVYAGGKACCDSAQRV